MNVCGILVHARPEKIDAVELGLIKIPGVETHGRAAGARIVVTVEDTDELKAVDAIGQVHALDGVVAAALVYHEFEPSELKQTQQAGD